MLMTKEQFVKEFAKTYEFTQKDTKLFLDSLFDYIEICLKEGKELTFSGFGKFEMVERKERSGSLNGVEWKREKTICPKFTFSKVLMDSFKGK